MAELLPPRARRPRITLDQLHTFLAIAETQHLRQAAEAIHLSQAAASQQLRLLERALGVPLFDRHGRRLRLTAFGRATKQAAAATLEAARSIEEMASSHRGLEQGQVVVAASNIMGVHRLPSWLAGFVHEYPHVDVQLRLDNMASALAALGSGAVDCAIVGGDLPRAAADEDTLFLERDELVIVVAAHHPLASSSQPFAELGRHRYLAREPGSGTESLAPRVLGRSYRRGSVQELAQGAILAALSAGLGYTVMPRTVVAADVAAGRLLLIDHPGRPVYIDFYATRRRGPHSPAAAAFFEYLRSVSRGRRPGTTS